MNSRLLDLPYSVPWVAVDTETSGLHPDDHARVACVSLTWPDIEPIASGPFVGRSKTKLKTLALPFDQGVRDKIQQVQLSLDDDGDAEDPNLGEAEWAEMLIWLSGKRLVMHHGKFDLTMLKVGTRHWVGMDLAHALHWDTMLTQRKLDPTFAAGLDVAVRRLGVGTGKEGLNAVVAWLKANGFPPKRYDLVPWGIIRPYVSTDTEDTAMLYLNQLERLSGDEFERPDWIREELEEEVELTRTLYRMEQRGVGYDHVASRAAAEVLEAAAVAMEKEMPFPVTEAAGKKYFFNELGLDADRVSPKTGKPSLDEEQVRKFRNEGVKWAQEYYEVSRRRRAVSMWYAGYADKMGADERLRGSFRQGHVKSGRMSIERVQLQAMPKVDKDIDGVPGVRKLLRPTAGKGLWSLDLSQAELRVASRYAGCSAMLKQLREGQDIHSNNTRDVLRVDEDDPMWKVKRDIAKRLTFGGIFQVGGETFMNTLSKLADLHLPLKECNALIRGWRAKYPEFGDAWEQSKQMAENQGWVPLLKGTVHEQQSWFGERDYSNTAWNRIVQGSLAEAFKHLLNGIERQWPDYMILTIHDSVLLECPLDEGDQVSAEVQAWGGPFMTDLFSIDMSMDIDRWDK